MNTSFKTEKVNFYILEDSSRSGLGGGQIITCKIAKEISAERLAKKVIIMDYMKNQAMIDRLGIMGLGIDYWGLSKRKNIASTFVYIANVIAIARRSDCVVYTATRYASALVGMCSILGKPGNQKWIVHEHMIAPNRRLVAWAYKRLIHKAQLIIFCSTYCQDSYRLREESRPRCIIYGSSVAEDLKKTGCDDAKVKEMLRNDSGSTQINAIYYGRVCKEKGIFELVSMFRRDRSDYKGSYGVKLWIFGPASDTNAKRLNELTEGLSSVSYHGLVEISRDLLSLFDVALVPSWDFEESLGLAAHEAFAYVKRALIASKSPAFELLLAEPGVAFLDRDKNIYGQIETAFTNGLENCPKHLGCEGSTTDDLIRQLKKLIYN